jgi:hypothetical protein
LIHRYNDLISLLFNFRLLLNNDVSQELFLKTLEGHSEVNQGHLDAYFGQVVRIWHLGCHEEPEVVVVVDVGVTESHLLKTSFSLESLLQQNGINSGIYELFNVLNKDRSSVTDTARDLTKEVVDTKLHQEEII